MVRVGSILGMIGDNRRNPLVSIVYLYVDAVISMKVIYCISYLGHNHNTTVDYHKKKVDGVVFTASGALVYAKLCGGGFPSLSGILRVLIYHVYSIKHTIYSQQFTSFTPIISYYLIPYPYQSPLLPACHPFPYR